MSPSQRSLSLVLALLAALALAAPASAGLAQRLERALTSPGVAWRSTGVIALDLPTGAVVYERNADVSLRPASNAKLPVALTALQELGPNYRIPTRVYGEGRLDGDVWRGRLVLKGFGDPTLARDDLGTLVREVRARGIRWVTGGVIADESYFDGRRTAPGWKRSYYKLESPPLSALIVGRGKVLGRTVDNPALVAGQTFRAALVQAGVRVMRGASVGRASANAARLADVFSPRIAQIVRPMMVESDNFYAEMLLKEIGARELAQGTTAAGVAVIRRVLKARGVPLAGVRLADGSGLSSLDRLTARSLVALLVSAWADPQFSTLLYRSLPVAGMNGTLRKRMTRPPAYGQVHAKTGTTRNASALSGYVTTRYVFAIVQNGSPIRWESARRGQDRFGQVLAGAAGAP